MLATLAILLPVFGLILAGYIARKRNMLGQQAAAELNKFVVWLALPALLFDIMAHATWAQLDHPAFIGTFTAGTMVVMCITLVWRMLRGRTLADASVDATSASYSNTGYLGFPLCLLLFGPQSQTPTMIATIIVVCFLFAGAIILIEIGLQKERNPLVLARKVAIKLLRNPLIYSPLLGTAVSLIHWTLPSSIETFLKLLSAAASPCALVSMGAFLAEKRPSAKLQRTSIILSAFKLVLQPALTWCFAVMVFHLDAPMTEMVVVLSALPTGTGPFMLAEFYKREAVVSSQTVLITTVLSLVSLTGLLAVMSPAAG